jgi:hypothetical protein
VDVPPPLLDLVSFTCSNFFLIAQLYFKISIKRLVFSIIGAEHLVVLPPPLPRAAPVLTKVQNCQLLKAC